MRNTYQSIKMFYFQRSTMKSFSNKSSIWAWWSLIKTVLNELITMNFVHTAISRQADMEIPVPSICLRAKYFPFGLEWERDQNYLVSTESTWKCKQCEERRKILSSRASKLTNLFVLLCKRVHKYHGLLCSLQSRICLLLFLFAHLIST